MLGQLNYASWGHHVRVNINYNLEDVLIESIWVLPTLSLVSLAMCHHEPAVKLLQASSELSLVHAPMMSIALDTFKKLFSFYVLLSTYFFTFCMDMNMNRRFWGCSKKYILSRKKQEKNTSFCYFIEISTN